MPPRCPKLFRGEDLWSSNRGQDARDTQGWDAPSPREDHHQAALDAATQRRHGFSHTLSANRLLENVADIRSEDLREGLVTRATVDSPWPHLIDHTLFTDTLDRIRVMAPTVILSSHLPAAHDVDEELLRHGASARVADPFHGLDQPGLRTLLGQLAER